MNMNFKVVFDYKGDDVLKSLNNYFNPEYEKFIRNSLENAFTFIYNLYADYTNSNKGYSAWNQEYYDCGGKTPFTGDDSEAEYCAFIASKGNDALKEIKNSIPEYAQLFDWMEFYVNPENANLHAKVRGGIDMSMHLEEIK